MFTVKEHTPGFVGIVREPHTNDVSNVQEIFSLPWLQHWQKNANFKRFSVSPPSRWGGKFQEKEIFTLMVELGNPADQFFVVAYITGATDEDLKMLPLWP